MSFSAWTKIEHCSSRYPEATSSKLVYYLYTTFRKVNVILDDEEAYSIFLQRLNDCEVANKRGSIVLDRLSGKEPEMDPDELAEHRRAQATSSASSSVRTASTRTGRVPKASRKVFENDCFADEAATKRNTAAVSKAAKQKHNQLKVQGWRLVYEH